MGATARVLLLSAVACAGSAPLCEAQAPKPSGRVERSGAPAAAPTAARDLPSPEVRWSWTGKADEVVLDGGTGVINEATAAQVRSVLGSPTPAVEVHGDWYY